MTSNIQRRAGLLAAAAFMAFPAAALAGGPATAVSTVKAHTDRADASLERAVAAYERGADRRGTAQLNRSRKQMGLATAEAAKLLRSADTTEERIAAAEALALVAVERDENVEELVEILDEAGKRHEKRVAGAARADTRGREKALAVLSDLATKLPADAATGIASAIAALSTDRADEVESEARALADSDVSRRSKRVVSKTVEASVEGQSDAAALIAGLIADESMPAESKEGLQKAYDAIMADHGSVADVLSRFSDRMPSAIRDFVSQIVTQAREDAQSMRDNRPAPPSGSPEGTPSGAPDGTTSGAPEGTPSGAPEGTPAP